MYLHKYSIMKNTTLKKSNQIQNKGFALISTIMVMSLMFLVAVSMLSLSSVQTRSASLGKAQQQAEANARMALMTALAELQKSVGPDQRISSYATILDESVDSKEINGVANARLLGVWDSWGAWLNAEYTNEDGESFKIDKTYTKGREKMFRRWLVSSTDSESIAFEFAKTGDMTDDSFITLVGDGSVENAGDRVRARLINVNNKGKYAWWVGGKNQAADVMAYGTTSVQDPDVAELSSGDNGSVAVNRIDGFGNLSADPQELQKVIDHRQLELAEVTQEDVRKKFFDVTQGSAGVLADVRWGGLKKDLNLLFEQSNLPREFRRNGTRAPSPRPMSSDLTAFIPKLPNRGFTSFEQMREFYRSYKSAGVTPLKWTGKAPSTEHQLGHAGNYGHAEEAGYHRMPVVAKHYSVYSTLTASQSRWSKDPNRIDHDVVFSTVMVLWNPYTTPLEIPDNQLFTYTLPYKILPSQYAGLINGNVDGGWRTLSNGPNYNQMGQDFSVPLRSDKSGQPIRFEPGQFRIFSKKGVDLGRDWEGNDGKADSELTPGYDPTGIAGQRMGIFTNKHKDDRTKWAVTVRLHPLWNVDGTAWWWAGNPGAFGNQLRLGGKNAAITGVGTMFDWTAADYDDALFSGSGPGSGPVRANGVEAASYDTNVLDEPVPFAVIGITLKSAALLDYGAVNPDVADYRSKNWIQGLNSVNLQKMHINYNDKQTREFQRLDNCYQLHFKEVTSINDLSSLISVDATGKLTSLSSDELVNSVPSLELPTAPVTSVAGFAGMRLTPGWYQHTPASGGIKNPNNLFYHNTYAYTSGVPGVGAGNSFAQPSIPGNLIYKFHDISKSNPSSDIGGAGGAEIDSLVLSDFWDHALLVNDGLWDSWFTSSMTDATRPSSTSAKDLTSNVSDFLKNDKSLPYKGYQYWKGSANNITTDQANTLAAEGYKTVAGILKNNSAFNVNSTSVDAWLALFLGLKERDVVYRDSTGKLDTIDRPTDGIVISRFMTAIGQNEVVDPRQGEKVDGIGKAWTGVREISNDQLLKLAEECVKQVKTRGPFLNMSDFINRRMSSDETGLTGALQAAIDYDDTSPDAESINYRYKGNEDMIPRTGILTASYPNQMAAGGSRFTGAPGYVVQSDLLRPLGNALTVRDDTFVIRAYGESLDSAGKVQARAWCEATVQRTPQYLDPTNSPEEPMTLLDSTGNPSMNPALTETNRTFGRRFLITSFRWLSPDEI